MPDNDLPSDEPVLRLDRVEIVKGIDYFLAGRGPNANVRQIRGEKLPYANDTWIGKQVRRVLNPAIFTSLSIELEGKSRYEKMKWYLNEFRWSILGKK